MAVTLPLEVCVSDLPSRLTFAANEAQPCLNLNVCLKVPVKDLVTALINFGKSQEIQNSEALKAQPKAEPKAAQPPGLLPPLAQARIAHESSAAAATSTDSTVAPAAPPPPALTGAPPEGGAAPTTALPPAAAGAATTADRGPPQGGPQGPYWNDCIAVLQPWHEDYTKKMRWTSSPPHKSKAVQLLKDLLLEDNIQAPALKAKVPNQPDKGYAPMPVPPPAPAPAQAPPAAAPPQGAPPAHPAAAQIAAALAASPGASSAAAAGQPPASSPGPGVGDLHEPESEFEETTSGQSAAPPNLSPPPEAPPPPPGISNGAPADGPPPGLAAAGPPGLPVPPGAQSAAAGRGTPQSGSPGQAQGQPNNKECKQQ